MYLAIDHHGDVSGVSKELHNLFASACLLCPPRLCVGILFKPANVFSIELKI